MSATFRFTGEQADRLLRLRVMPALLAAAALLAGCATPEVQPLPAEQIIRADLLAFLQDGVTTREQVLLKLGSPSMQFEQQRILTYQIRIDKDGIAHVFWPRRSELNPVLTHWEPEIFSLVLVFGPDGILQKHALVGAR